MSMHFGKTIYFIDIDETLFHQENGLVHVKDFNGKVVESLTNEQYNTHILKPGYSYDHSDFSSAKLFKENAKPIDCTLQILKQIINENKNLDEPDMIMILTARGDFDDKEAIFDFFDKEGVPIRKYKFVEFIRTGNINDKNFTNAKKKQAIVLSALITNRFSKFVMFDDAITNLEEFYKVKQSCYGTAAEFKIVHVIHDKIDGVNCNYRAIAVEDKDVEKYIDIYRAKRVLAHYGIQVYDQKVQDIQVGKDKSKQNKIDEAIKVKTTADTIKVEDKGPKCNF